MAEAQKTTDLRLAVLGAGKMGSILLKAFLKSGLMTADHCTATVAHAKNAEKAASNLGVPVTTDNLDAVRQSDVVLLCVKPQAFADVLAKISPALTADKLVISVAASVPISYMEERIPAGVPVIRSMPNTPAEVGAGITAISPGAATTQAHVDLAEAMFATVGKVVVADEKHMDAITGLSASGPAFVYIILESLAEGGVKVGLPRDLATLLAAQTVMGSAKVVLDTGKHPALLKDAVTTPAGCTVDGILELEEGGLRVTLIKAVARAATRAKELLQS